MSTPGWEYLRDTYGEAWRIRMQTGNVSSELLLDAFRKATPPAGLSVENLPGPVVIDLWNQGIEPRRLRQQLYRGMGRAVWRATVVPGKAIYNSFRGRSES